MASQPSSVESRWAIIKMVFFPFKAWIAFITFFSVSTSNEAVASSKINISSLQVILYAIHKDRPFFNDLIAFMSSGPIVAAVLEKENAVEDFRTLLGATNPEEAAEGTIRKLYANSVGENAVHGSDSDENSLIETQFHFSQSEIFSEI